MAKENIQLNIIHNPKVTTEDNGFAIDACYEMVMYLHKINLL